MRRASVLQGMRGALTSSTTVSPISSRSPTAKSALTSPSTVRFSPNVPGSSGLPIAIAHQS